MNRVRAFRLREIYDFVDAQIGIYRTFSLADLIRLVGLRPENSVFIFFRIIATVRIPSSPQALNILIAISPLFATRIFLNFFILFIPHML